MCAIDVRCRQVAGNVRKRNVSLSFVCIRMKLTFSNCKQDCIQAEACWISRGASKPQGRDAAAELRVSQGENFHGKNDIRFNVQNQMPHYVLLKFHSTFYFTFMFT